MNKYHIDEKGKVSRCFAFFKKCPRSQHFDDKLQAQHYVDELNYNETTYPEFSDETELMNPHNNRVILAQHLLDKNKKIIIKDKEVNLDTLIKDKTILLLNKNKKEDLLSLTPIIEDYIKVQKISKSDICKAAERIRDIDNQLYIEVLGKCGFTDEWKKRDAILRENTIDKNLETLYSQIAQYTNISDTLEDLGFQVHSGKVGNSNVMIINYKEHKDLYEKDIITKYIESVGTKSIESQWVENIYKKENSN